MAIYDKSKHFSWGWVLGGAALMFVTGFLSSFILIGTGVQNLYVLFGVTWFGYLVAGFVMGWQSEGQTIIEAGISAILIITLALGIKGFALALLNPVVMVLGIGPPFAFAILGAFIGEKVQGDVIETKDD